jgi:hypothetical protein
MAVAAAIGVGGLDEGDEVPSSNSIMDDHRLSKHLKNKLNEPSKSMHQMVLNTSLKSSEIPVSSSGGIIGEINRSIEKMSLTIVDAITSQCQSSKQMTKLQQNNVSAMCTSNNESSFTTLGPSEANSIGSICNINNTNRRGSNWTTVSTEGYGSMCGSDQISAAASRRPSDISVSSISQVIILCILPITSRVISMK